MCNSFIYDSKDCKPNNLLLDAGEIDCSTTGVKAAVVDYQLAPGLYFFVATFSGTPNINYLLHSYDQAGYILGARSDNLYHPYGGFYGTKEELCPIFYHSCESRNPAGEEVMR